jgi:predicted nucleic acid-binding protein
MAVLDASIVVEMLLGTPLGLDAFDHAVAEPAGMHAPHLVDIEVTHALRRLVLLGEVPEPVAESAVQSLALLQLERHGHLLLLPRVWELRDSLSPYDAAYVALAESLDMPIFTRDARLARAHGHLSKVVLFK